MEAARAAPFPDGPPGQPASSPRPNPGSRGPPGLGGGPPYPPRARGPGPVPSRPGAGGGFGGRAKGDWGPKKKKKRGGPLGNGGNRSDARGLVWGDVG